METLPLDKENKEVKFPECICCQICNLPCVLPVNAFCCTALYCKECISSITEEFYNCPKCTNHLQGLVENKKLNELIIWYSSFDDDMKKRLNLNVHNNMETEYPSQILDSETNDQQINSVTFDNFVYNQEKNENELALPENDIEIDSRIANSAYPNSNAYKYNDLNFNKNRNFKPAYGGGGNGNYYRNNNPNTSRYFPESNYNTNIISTNTSSNINTTTKNLFSRKEKEYKLEDKKKVESDDQSNNTNSTGSRRSRKRNKSENSRRSRRYKDKKRRSREKKSDRKKDKKSRDSRRSKRKKSKDKRDKSRDKNRDKKR